MSGSTFNPLISYNFAETAAAFSGSNAVPPEIVFPRDPTSSDLSGANGQYNIGQLWWSAATHNLFALASTAGGVAVWTQIGSGGGGSLNTINSATSIAGNINFVDSGTGALSFTGSPGQVASAVQVDGSSIVINGSDQLSLVSPVSPANGGTGVSNPTARTIPVAEGASAFHFVGPLANGQLLIGSSGADPVAASLSAGTGISVTPGAGSVSIANTGVVTLNSTASSGGNFNFTDSGTGALTFTPSAGQIAASVNVDGTTIQINGSDQLTVVSAGSAITTIDGNSGSVTGSTVTFSGTAPLNFAGAGSTMTVTASTATSLALGVVQLATNAQAIAGTDTSNAVTSAALAAKLGTQTAHGIALGEGSSSALNYSAALTNGQLLIGSAGLDPVPANLSAGSGIAIANGAGSISIATSGSVAVTYMEDSGSATPALGVLNINGTSSQGITTSGSGNSVVIDATSATTSQIGVSALSTNALAIAGVDGTTSVTPAALAAKLGSQTAHAVAIGEGVGSPLSYVGPGANGNVLTGMLASDPMWAAVGTNSGLTAHGVLLAEGNSPFVATSALGDGALIIGSAGVDPVVANLTAGSGVSIVNGPGSVTISSTAVSWTTTIPAMAVAGMGYIVTSGAASVALPTTSAVGDTFYISLQGGTSWTLTQAAGQNIQVGNVSSTVGTGGSLSSTANGDGIQLVCSVANTTFFSPVGPIGNLSIV